MGIVVAGLLKGCIIMEFYGMEAGEVLHEVTVNTETGLSTSEANTRLAKFGKKSVCTARKREYICKDL
jgi:hypothetical protein